MSFEFKEGPGVPEQAKKQEARFLIAPHREIVSDYPENDSQTEAQIAAAEQEIANLFKSQSVKELEKTEQEKLKKAKETLQEVDKNLALVEKKLARREAWFGKSFAEKSHLAQRKAELVAVRHSIIGETFGVFLEEIAIEPRHFFKATEDSGQTEGFTKRLWANIQTMKKLEKRVSGACARLADGYGIQCFGRYPVHMLQRQLEKEDDVESPYGMVLYSRDDWNGAFDEETSEEELSLLDRATQSVGLQVRIFECEGLVDAAKHLVRLDRKYGAHQKIQFAIVSGHGSEHSIELGKRSLELAAQSKTVLMRINDFVFGEEDIEIPPFPENAIKRIRTFFAENPTLILNSCLTAKGDKGLAQFLAETTDSEVIASQYPIGEFEVRSIEKSGNKYQFDVAFEAYSHLGGINKVAPRVFDGVGSAG